LSDGFIVKKRKIICNECSKELEIPQTSSHSTIKCVCGTTYDYNPALELKPYLVFEDQNKQTIDVPLKANVTIGRENKDYLSITSQLDPSNKQTLYIRNIYVSRTHSKLSLREELTYPKDNSQRIVSKKKCVLQDCGSTNGTAINHHLLKPNEEKELKQGDVITLAPNSSAPLTFTFQEKLP
jgi:pSer/pThr/pTyr-binding forkhead associated (FHA) protein